MPLPKEFPAKVDTVGDHIRAARVQRGLEQGQVARILRVTECTVWNWENHRSSPPVHQCKRVIDFIGYDPFPKPATMAERLIAYRRSNGMRVKDAAIAAGFDPCSWSSWERNEHEMTRVSRERIEKMIAGANP